ncbi:MAG: GntR family transcriptional regulator [Naasia sp.]|jgi:DNA-binding GntR family transcriptional regulator|uniref:GntR family transcriptional regulator n=1 Tax=Naasia sp. TaxID=2546198 RepID=UPI00262A3749|nr:GntR family transcriptional regulator [Naasia sp.]MCU1570890.1 GntR family transcriptional regulator [Naasia sp.]
MTVSTRELFRNLDRGGPVPLYFQVSEQLRAAIRGGILPPGSRIENEVKLADDLGMSRPTIRRAIQELVDQGLLVRRRGVGTQVVMGPIAREVELSSLHDDLVKRNRQPKTDVLLHELTPAGDEAAEQLGIEPGTEVLHIRRLRYADDVPFALLANHLSPELADLSREALTESGLYQLLRERGATMRVAKQTIGARAATAEEAGLLHVPPGSPLLTMARTLYDDSGHPVEYGLHSYRPDLYSFHLTVVER